MRTEENDIAMRLAVNEVSSAWNERNVKLMRERAIATWNTFFAYDGYYSGDDDALSILLDTLKSVAPDHDTQAVNFETIRAENRKTDRVVYALYDLEKHPPQFDFFTFMTQAKTWAQGRHLHIVFMPTEQGHFVRPGKYSNSEAIYRFGHICLAACNLYSVSHTLLTSRDAKLPDGEWLDGLTAEYKAVVEAWELNGTLARLRSTLRARELVSQFLEVFEKPVVTITLRDTFRYLSRNSQHDAWLQFADNISGQYQPVFVPDTSRAFDHWDKPYPCFPIGAVDLDSRVALYELSEMNCFSSNGPGNTCWLGHGSFLFFNTRAADYVGEEVWERMRIPVGSQPLYLKPRQKLVWEIDSLDVIEKEFSAMMA